MCQGGVVAGGRGAGDSLRHPILFMATGAGNLSGQDRQGFQRGQNRCHGDYQATWCSLCRQRTHGMAKLMALTLIHNKMSNKRCAAP